MSADQGPRVTGEPAAQPFTCPRCGRTSWHPEDKRQGYCGACHAFTASPAVAVRRGPMVAGEPAAVRLMRQLDYRLSPAGTDRLSPAQVAVVLHALADHTALEAARTYRRVTDEPGDFWPTSRAIGRWLHDTGCQLEDR